MSKEKRRGNREIRKPKAAKPAPAEPVTSASSKAATPVHSMMCGKKKG